VEISRFLENKALAVAFLNRELGTYSGKQLPEKKSGQVLKKHKIKLKMKVINLMDFIIFVAL